ncbi:hypothetical protein P7C73_g6106, partial [Tremellales sp. Uapishka_1]
MGFFNRKKKAASSSAPSSPALPSSATMGVAPPSPPLTPLLPPTPTLTLRVAVDSPSRSTGASSEKELFYVTVNPTEKICALRRVISDRIGSTSSLGLFKVSIPPQAIDQAKEYTERYGLPVNLVSTFPSFNLDDPTQLSASIGPAAWGMSLDDRTSGLEIKDWFPESTGRKDDTISILIRTCPGSSSHSVPLTLLAHVTQDASRHHSPRLPTSASPSRPRKRAPMPIDISPDATLDQLKAALLKADRRTIDQSALDQVVLWQVEMSGEEMVVIEERGGLRKGQMPWPYPPTAPVPVAMTDSSLPISHYFPQPSNCRMVNLSIWLPPTIAKDTTGQTISAPVFQYPMIAATPSSPALGLLRTPSSSYSGTSTIVENPLPMPTSGYRRRQRPSTAPTVLSSSGSRPRAFGSSSSGSIKRPSPLSSTTNSSSSGKGLGISVTFAGDRDRTSLSSIESHSPRQAYADGSLPSLNYSQSSLGQEDDFGLRTPTEEKGMSDFYVHNGDKEMRKSISLSMRRGAVPAARTALRPSVLG